jgi:sensor histidine kinase regulating citrate/malate metabolism
VFLLGVVIVLLLVLSAVAALVLQVRNDSDEEARSRSLAVAETSANAQGTREALGAPDPTAVLRPRAEAARRQAKVDFVVMNTDGIRYTHPTHPSQTGPHRQEVRRHPRPGPGGAERDRGGLRRHRAAGA